MSAVVSTATQSDVQRMLAESVDGFARRATDLSRVRDWRDREPGYDRALWQEMAELGWTGLLVSEAQGGSGLAVADMAVVARGLGAGLMPEPLASCSVLAARVLSQCENESLAAKLLAGIAGGETIAAVAFQERAGELLASDLEVRATIADDSISLNGSKRFVVGAAGADGFVVSAATGAGIALFWVPADNSGLRVSLQLLADGRFGGQIDLDGATVPANYLLARENTAPVALSRAIDDTTVIICAELVGLMGSALDMTLEYLRTRVQFGKAIGSFQSLQHRSVDLYIAQQLAAASLADALEALEHRPNEAETAATLSRAKARCADAAALITRQAIQMHGAIGFTEDSDVGLFVKRALTLNAWLGNSAWHRRRFLELAPAETER